MPDRLLARACDELATLLEELRAQGPALARLCRELEASWDTGGKLLVCGNGGSCADAMHLVEELVARFEKTRRALAAVALADPTVLTCAANDFGYEHVFSRQVEALGRPGDVLLVISTSGTSPNVLRALEAARARGLRTAGFLGKGGGSAGAACDVAVVAPGTTSHRIQEGHKVLLHTLCQWADDYASRTAQA